MPVPKGYRHKTLRSVKGCAKGSFRRIRSGAALITICCPKGAWKPRVQRCRKGMRAIGLDKPRRKV